MRNDFIYYNICIYSQKKDDSEKNKLNFLSEINT